jgi:iron complex outermembrane receptor protein
MGRVSMGLRCGAGLLALIIGSAAAAQSIQPPPDVAENPATTAQEPTSGGEIVVTGSRIRRDPLSQDAPIVFVDSDDIAKTGLNSVNDVLQRLPSSGGGLNSKFNNSGNLGNPPDGGGVGAGSAEVDLRYLGSRRVLVLVDGLRYVNGASASGVPGSTDLNSIPDSMIERIEVLQDGASSIYGSDAIAGVVNIITKKKQKGLQASAQLGGYDEGDGFTQNYQISWGNGDDSATQFVVGGNFVKQNGVRSADRDISAFPQPYSTSCLAGGCSGTALFGQFRPFGVLAPPDDPLTEDVNENRPVLALRDVVIGRPVYNPADPFDPASDYRQFTAADAFNFAPYNFIQTPLKRYGLFANVRQELGENLNFSAKAIWNKRESKNQAAPLPLLVGQGAGNHNLLDTIDIDVSNPYNPFLVTLDESNYIMMRRRVVELGPRKFDQTVKTIYGVATLDGSFNAGGHQWYWDINGSYGRNKAKQVMHGNINSDNLRIALGPVDECAAVTGCVPFNLFGGPGTITQDMLDFVGFVQHDSSKQTSLDFTANISGSLFDLPGGPLGVAAGLEYRKLKGRFDPDPVVSAGFSSDIPAQPTKGSYNVKEAYAEINAPLLSDLPFADLLELSGAVRFSDYSTSGSTTTFKAGANWKPIPDLRLRVTWAEGFRAPSIGELFGTFSRFDSAFDDPCSSNSALPRNIDTDAAVAANCALQGGVGATTLPDDQLSVITGGNENLKPETSKSWVIGGVYAPSFIPRLSLEVNWYKISIDDSIQAFPAQLTVTNCVYNNDATACDRITRSVSGDITGIDSQLENLAGIRTKGIDANLAYRTNETGVGRFGFTWNNTFLRNYDIIVPTADGVQVVSREGTEVGSPSQAFPKWKSVGIVDWDLKSFGATVTGRYIKSVRETNADNRIKSMFYTDLQLRWTSPDFADNFGFALGVNNLFNVKAPACFGCDVNGFDPTTYDVPGRYLYARASVKM